MLPSALAMLAIISAFTQVSWLVPVTALATSAVLEYVNSQAPFRAVGMGAIPAVMAAFIRMSVERTSNPGVYINLVATAVSVTLVVVFVVGGIMRSRQATAHLRDEN